MGPQPAPQRRVAGKRVFGPGVRHLTDGDPNGAVQPLRRRSSARRSVHSLSRTPARPPVRGAGHGISDYEQELVADLLERSDRFDPSRSSYPTFADRLIRKRVASLLESGSRIRCAAAGGQDDHAVVDAALETEGLWPTSQLPAHERTCLRLDLERFIERAANPTAPLLHVAHGLEPAHGRVRDGPASFLPLRGGGRVEAARRRGWSRPLSVIGANPTHRHSAR